MSSRVRQPLAGVFTFLLILLISAATPKAIAAEKPTFHPCEEWLENNPLGYMYNYVLPDYILVTFRGTLATIDSELDADCEVTKQVAGDGLLLVTVSSRGSAPFTLYRTDEVIAWEEAGGPQDPSLPIPEAVVGDGLDGKMNFLTEVKIVLFTADPDPEIPFIFEIESSGQGILLGLKTFATGFGTITDHGADFGMTPGARAKVHLTDPFHLNAIRNRTEVLLPSTPIFLKIQELGD